MASVECVLLLVIRFLTEGTEEFENGFEDWPRRLGLWEAKERLDDLGELLADAFLLVSCSAVVYNTCSPVFEALKGRYLKQDDGFYDFLLSSCRYNAHHDRERLVVALALVELRMSPLGFSELPEEVMVRSRDPETQQEADSIIAGNARELRYYAERLQSIRRAEGMSLWEAREWALDDWARRFELPFDMDAEERALETALDIVARWDWYFPSSRRL